MCIQIHTPDGISYGDHYRVYTSAAVNVYKNVSNYWEYTGRGNEKFSLGVGCHLQYCMSFPGPDIIWFTQPVFGLDFGCWFVQRCGDEEYKLVFTEASFITYV